MLKNLGLSTKTAQNVHGVKQIVFSAMSCFADPNNNVLDQSANNDIKTNRGFGDN